MIECPRCNHKVILVDNLCPECRHEVLPEHLRPIADDVSEADWTDADEAANDADEVSEELNIEEMIMHRFKCAKCGHAEAEVNEVAMSGTGLSKILDIEYRHYLLVHCLRCGYVEAYQPDVLRGHKSGRISTILDLLFG